MRKNILSLFLLCGLAHFTYAQPKYWQQQADYRIMVTLDDVHHMLRGEVEITYTNNSPNDLDELYLHLWPNAYAGRSTVFNQELLNKGETKFQYADESQYGYIDSLSFKAYHPTTKQELVIPSLNYPNPKSKDVAILKLTQALKRGESLILSTPFREKLPYSFSRGGHYGQSYQVTQWFPKMAMYDQSGWHPHHYTEQSEYYDNFGNYDVQITLPSNYVVAATGNLMTASENEWLQSLIGKNRNIRSDEPSSTTYKTIQYVQKNVHDFAWFADKQYIVDRSSVVLPGSKRNVDTWTFYLPEHQDVWKNATRMIDSSVYYYSLWVGDYLYSQATAVDGHLLAGGGMEYPNITIIAGNYRTEKSLESVIAHEVGHNWFQGMLGFNESNYPWLDEGFNTYYQNRYMEKRYPNLPDTVKKKRRLSLSLDMDDVNTKRDATLLTYMHRRHDDQPVCLAADAFTSMNYGLMVYMKAPFAIKYLALYLGQGAFDQSMQNLFATWNLKHPQPDDVHQSFKEEVPQDLDWFFNSVICSKDRMDYKIIRARDTTQIAGTPFYKVKVRNSQRNKIPFTLSSITDDKTIQTKWYGGFTGTNTVLFPYTSFQKLALDADYQSIEYKRQNNYIRMRGLCRKTEPFQVKLIGGIEQPEYTSLYIAPAFGFNYYNKMMYGIVLHNGIIPNKHIEWQLIPLYSQASGNINGFGRINTFLFPRANSLNIEKINFNVTANRFAYGARNDDQGTRYFDELQRLQSMLKFSFTAPANISKHLSLQHILMYGKEYRYDLNPVTQGLTNFSPDYFYSHYFRLIYELSNRRIINPYSLRIVNESGYFTDIQFSYLSRMTAELNYRISYSDKKGLDIRLFGGYDPNGVQPIFLAAGNGHNDYTADHYFMGRFEQDGLYAHQVSQSGGMMKFNTASYNGRLGEGYSAAAINLKSSLPVPLFFLFADAGFYNSPSKLVAHESVLFDAGIGLQIIPGVFEVYLPLLASSDIRNNIFTQPEYNIWYKRILFTLELQKLDPFRWVRNFSM